MYLFRSITDGAGGNEQSDQYSGQSFDLCNLYFAAAILWFDALELARLLAFAYIGICKIRLLLFQLQPQPKSTC